ncbi:sensor histidine kinase [Legionella cincinnatiensis]|uniref:histidine kinase n=1 Tax=Legionella cincinnatiensis TaxID=28085 RepID=A0A378IKY7_9GAMM|nr:ATP-binding protein [Legionella cincinnatiensis]KTC83215.1 Two-component sensor histidine kinase [Legionella cincinnatiensis]STX35653.1 Two-component sensor histidine kinase [Legionella cincinnatiensis]
MDIHKLLKRQLARSKIDPNQKPENTEQWLTFLNHINNTYIEAEQERCMRERARAISSRKMMKLKEKLERAQHIVGLGYWSYDGNTDHTIWSNELFKLFHLNPINKPPSLREFIELIHIQDRCDFVQKVERALSEHIDYECEIRVKNPNREYRWYRMIGQCADADKHLTGIMIDIHKNKRTEEKIKELNHQISSAARRAGMAEVATTILHNIGNILNSSNVSIALIKNSYKQAYHKKLIRILTMIEQHHSDLAYFLNNDPKGMIIPKFLLSLSKIILEEDARNNIEIDNLQHHLQHINQIVDMQKSISGLSNFKESVYIPELIDIALNITMDSSKKDITIVKDFQPAPLIFVDKAKLLHILINLLQNAKDSVLDKSPTPIKEIKISIQKLNKESLQIIISDNGIGITSDNLHHIFAYGFTTKKNGHGFGLHSSALSAKEIGGKLFAESCGEGYGAQFILTLPVADLSKQGEIYG